MAEGHNKHAWDHTSALLCFLAEPYRDRKKHPEPFKPAEFNPYAEKPKQEPIRVPFETLRTLFVKDKK